MDSVRQHIHSMHSASGLVPALDAADAVGIGLTAAVIRVRGDEPQVLLVGPAGGPSGTENALPSGQFAPHDHGSLEAGLRYVVLREAGLELVSAEQLYTFANAETTDQSGTARDYGVWVGYLGLVRPSSASRVSSGVWRCWYDYLPWEDWRHGKPGILGDEIETCLRAWANQPAQKTTRWPRLNEEIDIAFGLRGASWDEEKALQRFDLLAEAGLIGEANRSRTVSPAAGERLPALGLALRANHRRILAMAMGRLRTEIKYRPVVFELMADEFTLFELQKTVEAILGPHLHKQNFRRLIENMGLVEPTGEVRANTGGRPAKLFRFRRSVLLERAAPGVRIRAGCV